MSAVPFAAASAAEEEEEMPVAVKATHNSEHVTLIRSSSAAAVENLATTFMQLAKGMGQTEQWQEKMTEQLNDVRAAVRSDGKRIGDLEVKLSAVADRCSVETTLLKSQVKHSRSRRYHDSGEGGEEDEDEDDALSFVKERLQTLEQMVKQTQAHMNKIGGAMLRRGSGGNGKEELDDDGGGGGLGGADGDEEELGTSLADYYARPQSVTDRPSSRQMPGPRSRSSMMHRGDIDSAQLQQLAARVRDFELYLLTNESDKARFVNEYKAKIHREQKDEQLGGRSDEDKRTTSSPPAVTAAAAAASAPATAAAGTDEKSVEQGSRDIDLGGTIVDSGRDEKQEGHSATSSTTSAAATNGGEPSLASLSTPVDLAQSVSTGTPSQTAYSALFGSGSTPFGRPSVQAQTRALALLFDEQRKTSRRLAELSRITMRLRDDTDGAFRRVEADMNQSVSTVDAMQKQWLAAQGNRETALENIRRDHSEMIGNNARAVEELKKTLERKADVRLVLDKVSRTEYAAQIRRLRHETERLSERVVARSEYKSELNDLRMHLSAAQQKRQANITSLANEIQKLMSDVSRKASKADLIHVSNVLDSFPKVHDELESLRVFLNQQIGKKTEMIMDNTVDRKSLKRTMDKLLRSLSEEISFSQTPSACDSCAVRTGARTGTACLSCAGQLRSATAVQDKEFIPSRGGGFLLVNPRSVVRSNANAELLSSSLANGSSRRPGSRGGREDLSRGGAGYSPRAVNLAPLTLVGSRRGAAAGSMGNGKTVGADGIIYRNQGSRTHRLKVKNGGGAGADQSAGAGNGVSRRARMAAQAKEMQQQQQQQPEQQQQQQKYGGGDFQEYGMAEIDSLEAKEYVVAADE